MSDYIKIDWADVRAGDVLMHENGDRLTVRLTDFEGESSQLFVGGAWRVAEHLSWAGFDPYRKVEPVPPEPMPTEPGAYHDKDGDYWLIDRAGNWYDWSSLSEPNPRGGRPNPYAPFTRLVPMPSSDAVMEAVQRAEPMCLRERITDAVMALLRGGDNE